MDEEGEVLRLKLAGDESAIELFARIKQDANIGVWEEAKFQGVVRLLEANGIGCPNMLRGVAFEDLAWADGHGVDPAGKGLVRRLLARTEVPKVCV